MSRRPLAPLNSCAHPSLAWVQSKHQEPQDDQCPPSFRRAQADTLQARLREPRRFLQVVSGPRQVGKTTLVRQVLEDFAGPAVYATADEPGLRGGPWLA